MIGKIASFFAVLVLLATLPAVAADESAPADQPDLLVMRNGEILEGKVSRQDDRYRVLLTDGEIRLPSRDVDFLCHSLQEAYDVQSRRIAGQRIEDRLRLAAWCLRHNLTGPAAQELAAAKSIDSNDRRAAVLDRRLQEMLNPTTDNAASEPDSNSADSSVSPPETATNPKLPASTDELERMARNLPRGTLESYSSTILPMLMNHCATAGCHSVGTQSKFILLRPTSGSPTARRLTLRDLHNTLDWVDYDRPTDSKLVSVAHQSHGGSSTPPIEKEDSREYQQLVAWVMLATQGDKNSMPVIRPATVTPRAAPKASLTQATEQPAAAATATPQPNINPLPAGAGWANAIAPPGKNAPNLRVATPGVKSIRPLQSAPATTAKATDPNVKPAAAPQATP